MISNSSKSNYLYDLPDENPNGVISFDSKLNLLYSNNSAKKKFLPDFDVNSKQIKDKELKNELIGFLKSKKKKIFFTWKEIAELILFLLNLFLLKTISMSMQQTFLHTSNKLKRKI